MHEPDLIDRLTRIQTAHDWTDEEMSRRAGMTRAMWSMVRRRKSKMGVDTLGSVLRGFPELRESVLNYLTDDPETVAA